MIAGTARYPLDRLCKHRKIAKQKTRHPLHKLAKTMSPSFLFDTQEAANKMAAYTACQTVFGTAELVEQILAH